MQLTTDHGSITLDSKTESVLNVLVSSRKGGFATVHGYVSGTNDKKCVKPSVSNITFTSRFSYKNYVQRSLDVAKEISMGDISIEQDFTQKDFDKAMGELIASYEKTLSDDHSDAHRQAHDTYYHNVSEGIRIKWKTEKVNGETKLVLENGKPVVDDIHVAMIRRSKTVIEEGEYLPTKSRLNTIIKNAIKKKVEGTVGKYKNIVLRQDNFSHLTIDGNVILKEEM